MDPFSAEGELLNVHTAFHQGQYDEVVSFDSSALSASNKIPAKVLRLRAQLALGQTGKVLAEVGKDDSSPDLVAVKALALHLSGKAAEGLSVARRLAVEHKDNASVQILAGTVLHLEGKHDEALALLNVHEGSLEAVALIVQIQLQQNRTDLALKEVQAAKKWAQDSQLINIAESWVGMRIGGDRYQQAFYVFEEMAQAPSTKATKSLVAQAVAELHLGRLPEAEAALQQAIEESPENAETIANTIVLTVILGKDPKELVGTLQKTAPKHLFLTDLEAKAELFDKAASKYSPKVSG
ncbi:MAG: hypothetical protein M1814_000753 [Vezdaea aestivalis]|nr:MAG: hypothetical protein M1814_000753 [Vezdaea aestivalis]